MKRKRIYVGCDLHGWRGKRVYNDCACYDPCYCPKWGQCPKGCRAIPIRWLTEDKKNLPVIDEARLIDKINGRSR